MLLERLYYPNDYPIRIAVHTLAEDPIHYHPDIEIVYVLAGEIRLKNGYYNYHLRAGDVFVNSGNEVHALTAVTADNVIAQIHIRTRDLSHYFPDLSQACYRTYTKKPGDQRYERLKTLLLQLLIKNGEKAINYRSECLYLLVDIIRHLNRYFNLFAFDQDMVVGFDRGNQLATERISRICTYVYQNYANAITLEELGEMEHLSSYYISHLVRNFTGMNFRDFLCFARVEMSEARLLGSDHKISQIAQEVGFSTTAYYKKYFTKWFGHDPETHRALYKSAIKSDLKPAVFHAIPAGRTMELLREAYAAYDAKENSPAAISSLRLEMEVSGQAGPLRYPDPQLRLILSQEDILSRDPALLAALDLLSPEEILLPSAGEDTEAAGRLQTQLSLLMPPDRLPRIRTADAGLPMRASGVYACDSILYPL